MALDFSMITTLLSVAAQSGLGDVGAKYLAAGLAIAIGVIGPGVGIGILGAGSHGRHRAQPRSCRLHHHQHDSGHRVC